jgi:hypothetical protein
MLIEEVDLSRIRNRNEERVERLMGEVLVEFTEYRFEDLDIQDIYALTLNKLPARYKQQMSIILREPVSDDTVKDKIRESIRTVMERPNH